MSCCRMRCIVMEVLEGKVFSLLFFKAVIRDKDNLVFCRTLAHQECNLVALMDIMEYMVDLAMQLGFNLGFSIRMGRPGLQLPPQTGM